MHKKLIALAIAGLSTAAFADTSAVTIYGVADVTFDSINVGDGHTTSAGGFGSGPGGFQRVSTNSSLIGFKGAETMGDLTAVFQFESAVSFDAQGSLAANRDSYAGLAGGFGTVVMGNITGPTRALGAAVDVNSGATGIGANSGIIGKLDNNLVGNLDTATPGALTASCSGRSATCAGAFDNRFKNTLAYISPDFSGFKVIVGYIPNENKGMSANNSQPSTSAYDIGGFYANGPIYAGLTTSSVDIKDANDTKAGITRFAGSYDFGVAKLRGLYDKTTVKANGGTDLSQVDYGVGVTVPMGGGTLLAQYYSAQKLKDGGSDVADTGANLVEIGYEYSLSKRTMLIANYSKIDNKNASAYDFGVNDAGAQTTSTNATTHVTTLTGAGVTPGASVSGFQIGMRHTF